MKMLLAGMMIVLMAAPAMAATASNPIPPDLLRVDSKPVPSSCLAELETGEAHPGSTVDLRNCGTPGLKVKATPDGMMGYDDPAGGYFYYRYLGQLGDMDIILENNSGGGSGEFSGLDGIRRDGNSLRLVHTIAGGDRCNGGISNAAVKNGRLTFDQAITPYDLVALATPKPKLEAYKDLESSAASCIGVSHMTGDDKHWTGVMLDKDAGQDQSGWTADYKYQVCFNALYRQTVAKGQTELGRNDVMAFAGAFMARCVKP